MVALLEAGRVVVELVLVVFDVGAVVVVDEGVVEVELEVLVEGGVVVLVVVVEAGAEVAHVVVVVVDDAATVVEVVVVDAPAAVEHEDAVGVVVSAATGPKTRTPEIRENASTTPKNISNRRRCGRLTRFTPIAFGT